MNLESGEDEKKPSGTRLWVSRYGTGNIGRDCKWLEALGRAWYKILDMFSERLEDLEE